MTSHLKHAALIIALSLPVPVGAAVSYHQLGEWNGFADETATPAAESNTSIDWNGLGRKASPASYALIEWNGFAMETAAPKVQVANPGIWKGLFNTTKKA